MSEQEQLIQAASALEETTGRLLGCKITNLLFLPTSVNSVSKRYASNVEKLLLQTSSEKQILVEADQNLFPFGISISLGSSHKLSFQDFPNAQISNNFDAAVITKASLFWETEERLHIENDKGRLVIRDKDSPTQSFSFPQDLYIELSNGTHLYIRAAIMPAVEAGLSSSNHFLTIVFDDGLARDLKMGQYR